MNRAAILLASCLMTLSASESPGAANTPLFDITVYAPEQTGSPLPVVGLHYEEGFIRPAFRNDSDKAVEKVAIAAVEVAPPGCGSEPRTRIHVGGSLETLYIPPHEIIVTPALGNPPTFPAAVLITNAQRLQAASLHVQIVVMEVDFADGTKWKSHEQLPETPFDPSLVGAGRCPDVAAVTKALSAIDEFEFNRKIERPREGGDEESGPLPRLSFFCSLEGLRAICPR